MSSADRCSRRRVFLLRAGLVLSLALPLAGCFQPLYAPSALGENGVADQLAQISVADIPDRMGHFLTVELQYQLGRGTIPTAPRYQLDVRTRTTTQVAIIDRNTDRADSASQITVADYALRDRDGKLVTYGVVTANASYDRSSQQFANLRAARNSEERIAKLLAEQIRFRLTSALLSKGA